MNERKNTSNHNKHNVIMMAVSCVAIFIAVAIITANYLHVQRNEMKRNLLIFSSVITDNISTVIRDNEAAKAKSVLGVLAADRHIIGAAVYNASGKQVATYTRADITDDPFPDEAPEDTLRFVSNQLELSQEIYSDEQVVGRIVLLSDTRALNALIKRHAVFSGIALLVSCLVVLLAGKLFSGSADHGTINHDE